MVEKESKVDHKKKSESHELVVKQINESVETVDEIINRLHGVKNNLLMIKE